jgi:hypothetical protein
MSAAREHLPRKGSTERIRLDAFYGGVCCALQAGFYLDSGTGTGYLEVVGSVGPRDLLNYARREQDPELPNIRRAVKSLRDADRRWASPAKDGAV